MCVCLYAYKYTHTTLMRTCVRANANASCATHIRRRSVCAYTTIFVMRFICFVFCLFHIRGRLRCSAFVFLKFVSISLWLFNCTISARIFIYDAIYIFCTNSIFFFCIWKIIKYTFNFITTQMTDALWRSRRHRRPTIVIFTSKALIFSLWNKRQFCCCPELLLI